MWTFEHIISYLPALLFMIALSVILRRAILKRGERTRYIPLLLVAVFMIALECLKQISSIEVGYNLYHIPLHYCSLFLISVPLAALPLRGVRKFFGAALSATSTALFILMAVAPALVYSRYTVMRATEDFISLHSLLYHFLAVLALLLLLALDLHTPSPRRDIPSVIIFVGAYSLVGGSFAQLLKTNFNNFYFCEVEAVDKIRLSMIEALGYPLGQGAYVILAAIVNIAFTVLAYFIYVGAWSIINKKCKKALDK